MNMIQSLNRLDDVMDECKSALRISCGPESEKAPLFMAFAELQKARVATQDQIERMRERAEPRTLPWGSTGIGYNPNVVVTNDSASTADGHSCG